jgi:hypothetical protein
MQIPRIHVSFVLASAWLEQDTHPPGEHLAIDIVEALLSNGIVCSDIENWRDVGWSWSCSSPEYRHCQASFSLSAMYPLQERRWLLDGGVLRAWRLWNRPLQRDFLRKLALAVHDELKSDSRIGDIRWYCRKPAFAPSAEWEAFPPFQITRG